MNTVLLGLGSNLKCPERQIRLGLKALGHLSNSILIASSPLYTNPAWGRKAQPSFINTVALLKTRLSPLMLLAQCQSIEAKQGRVRRVKNSSRSLDIDLLWYENRQIHHPRLHLPHPGMRQREFVLIPLNDLLSLYPDYLDFDQN